MGVPGMAPEQADEEEDQKKTLGSPGSADLLRAKAPAMAKPTSLLTAKTDGKPALLAMKTRAQAKEEIQASKKKLEDQFSLRIDHFAYPFGDYNLETVELVQEAGFQTACTMHRGINRRSNSVLELARWTARYESRTLRNVFRSLFG